MEQVNLRFETEEPILVRQPLGPPPLALRVAAIVAVPLLLYALVATGQKALDNYRLHREADALRAEVLALRYENLELQRDIELARRDVAIETIAREQLGLIKPGDQPLILVGDQSPPSAPLTPALSQRETESRPPWRQWFDLFFG
jgi:cell division protein FtsB